jgi:hypothetical protein
MVPRRPGIGRIGRIDWSALPIHSIAVAAFPVLFLFAENAEQQVTLAPLWGPLAMAVAGGLGTLLACAALLHDWRRGALLATLLLALFFSFGHAWTLVGGFFDGRRYLTAAWAFLAAAGGGLIWRGGRWREGRWVAPTTRFLNLVTLLLLAFNGLRVVDFATGSIGPVDMAEATPAASVDPGAVKRDIYYIILDRYANGETLERIYDHDNEPFLAALEARGFAVARDAWANYFKTAFSLTSSLSMEYLDAEALKVSEPPTMGPLHSLLRGPLPVTVTLKSLGYEYVHLGNYWEPTATNADADIVLRYQDASEFSAALRSTTALMLLSPLGSPDDNDPETIEFDDLARDTTLFAFERLEESASRPGPTFVFAHILVPHPPYVFDADGSMPTQDERDARREREEYVRQLAWANDRVLQAIDRLLDVPAGQEPIIVLQSDEGPWPPGFSANQREFPWLDASADEVQQKFGILNAFHLPGVDAAAAGVHDRTSPVNEFRIVFNSYFGTDLPLLPDVTYLSPDYARMYDFVPYPRD